MGLDCLITFISEHKFYICHAFLIVIVPDLQESVYERMKKSGGATPFNLFVISEMECMHRLLAAVRETLLVSELCHSLSCSYRVGICEGLAYSFIVELLAVHSSFFTDRRCESADDWCTDQRSLCNCHARKSQIPSAYVHCRASLRIGTNIRSFVLVHTLPFSVRVLYVQELHAFISLLC